MRRNFTIRKSTLPEYYDTVYDYLPDMPHVSKVTNHPRKLITINRSADPYYSHPMEVFHEPTFPFY